MTAMPGLALLDLPPPFALAQSALDILALAGPLHVAERSGRILYRNPALRALLAEMDEPLAARLAPGAVAKLARHPGPLRLTQSFATARRNRTFALRYEPLPAAGGDGLVVGFFEEITQSTELLRNFKRYRDRSQEFLSIVSDWVWETDGDWALTYTVGRAGEQAVSDLAGRDLLSLGHFVDLADHPPVRPPNRRTRAPFQDRPFQLTAEGLGDRILLLSAIPVFAEDSGSFLGYRGSGRDITAEYAASQTARAYRQKLETTLGDLRAANEQLDRALVEVRAADRAKSSFLGMMGHELRTPLNAVIGFADVLKGEMLGPLGNPRYVEYAADILSSGKHLLSLINDILVYVKIVSGEVELEGEPVDVADLLESALRSQAEQIRRGGIEFVLECPSPLIFVSNERHLLQIVGNLLSNAVKFTREKGVVSLQATIEADGLLLRIRDTGVGIAAERLSQVLKPFQQADQRLAREFEGTGLGLPLAHAMTTGLGGTLTLESTLGEGTLVTIRLPHPPPAAAQGAAVR